MEAMCHKQIDDGRVIIIIIIIKGIYIAQVRKGHKCAKICVYHLYTDDLLSRNFLKSTM